MKYLSSCALLGMTFVFIAFNVLADNGGSDKKVFSKGANVDVYLHLDTFEDEDFPDTFNQSRLEQAIKAAIIRWTQTTGGKLNFRYKGLSANDDDIVPDEDSKELHISAIGDLGGGRSARRLAGTFFLATNTPNAASIIFARKFGNGATIDWDVFIDSDEDAQRFYATLLHELGHAWGLEHNNDSDGTTIMQNAGQSEHAAYGPYEEDIEDVLSLYGVRDKTDIQVLVSKDHGSSWQTVSSDIDASTYSPGSPVSVNRDNDRMVAFYRDENRHPRWRVGDKNAKDFGSSWYRSSDYLRYGIKGHGYNKEYMMIWARESDGLVKVRHGTWNEANQCVDWSWRSPPTSYTAGTPAILQLDSNKNTWVMAYTQLDLKNGANSGKVAIRISTDDGKHWSNTYIPSSTKAIGAVALTASETDEFRVAYSMMSDDSAAGTSLGGRTYQIDVTWDGSSLRFASASLSLVSEGEPSAVSAKSGPHVATRKTDIPGQDMGSDGAGSIYVTRANAPTTPNNLLVDGSLAAYKNSDWIYLFYTE